MRWRPSRCLAAVAAGGIALVSAPVARADPFFDPTNVISRPLTLPAHQLSFFAEGGARHLENGVVFVGSNLGAAYGVTDRFQIDLNALAVEYAPTTRVLGPSGSATYALLERGVALGLRLGVSGVVSPSAGVVLTPSIPIRIPLGARFRLDLGPEVPIILGKSPVVGVVAPFGVTFQINEAMHAHFDTAAALYDVKARSIVVPAKLSYEITVHVKSLPLALVPFFAFPTLFTPGEVPNRFHPKDYAGGLALVSWVHL